MIHVDRNIKNEKNKLVSVIMPAYNCEEFIADSIQSIQNQTYENWELLIADDCSTDHTREKVKEFEKKDSRVRLIQLEKNEGAAVARNAAIKIAQGDYLAFLDSDDLWKKEKLELQLAFMEKNHYLFTCTSFEKINEEESKKKEIVTPKVKADYHDVLKNNPGNSTIIYNCKKTGKIYSPNIRKRNDYAMWLQLIKKTTYVYGLQEPLTQYRVREGSLSHNKRDLVKYQWKVYREIEHLNIGYSLYLLTHKVLSVLMK